MVQHVERMTAPGRGLARHAAVRYAAGKPGACAIRLGQFAEFRAGQFGDELCQSTQGRRLWMAERKSPEQDRGIRALMQRLGYRLLRRFRFEFAETCRECCG